MTQRYQSCNKQRERESFGIIYQIFSENLSVIEIKRPQTVMNKPVYLGLSILEISFGRITLKQNIQKNRNYVTWIQTDFQSTHDQNTFTQTFQKMLQLNLILQIMNQTDHYLKEKKHKSNQINER